MNLQNQIEIKDEYLIESENIQNIKNTRNKKEIQNYLIFEN